MCNFSELYRVAACSEVSAFVWHVGVCAVIMCAPRRRTCLYTSAAGDRAAMDRFGYSYTQLLIATCVCMCCKHMSAISFCCSGNLLWCTIVLFLVLFFLFDCVHTGAQACVHFSVHLCVCALPAVCSLSHEID